MKFLRKILAKICPLRKGNLIVGGKFNKVNNPLLDSSATSRTKYGHLDSYMTMTSPTFGGAITAQKGTIPFFATHGPYSRIDLFLCDKLTLQQAQSSFIGDITWSDHAAIGVRFGSRPRVSHRGHWKLNPFLLAEPATAQEIGKAHKVYFDINDPGETDEINVWKA